MAEHPAVHPEHSHHMKYWGGVRDKAEECVKSVLEGGNERVTLHEAIGKAHIEHPEDWDALMDFCKENEAHCSDINRLNRAMVMWLHAYNELEYKKSYV